jgi:hypothetical protein
MPQDDDELERGGPLSAPPGEATLRIRRALESMGSTCIRGLTVNELEVLPSNRLSVPE